MMIIRYYTALGPLAPLISIDTAPPIPVVWIVGVPTESLLPLLTDFLLVIRGQQQVQGIIIFNNFYLRNYEVLSTNSNARYLLFALCTKTQVDYLRLLCTLLAFYNVTYNSNTPTKKNRISFKLITELSNEKYFNYCTI